MGDLPMVLFFTVPVLLAIGLLSLKDAIKKKRRK
jgi:hypothetical protein